MLKQLGLAITCAGLVGTSSVFGFADRVEGIESAIGQAVHIGGFQVDRRWKVSGGRQVGEAAAATHTGVDQHQTNTPTQFTISDLSLNGLIDQDSAFVMQWLTQMLNSNDSSDFKRDVTTAMISQQAETFAGQTYRDTFIHRYVYPKMNKASENIATETLVLRAHLAESANNVNTGPAMAQNHPGRLVDESRFDLNLQNCPNMSPHILSIDIDDLVFPPVPVQDGRNNMFQEFRPGQPKYGHVTLTFNRKMDHINELQSLWTNVTQGQNVRRTITIGMKNRADDVVRQYSLIDCVPVEYQDATFPGNASSGPVIAIIKFKIGRVEFDDNGGSSSSAVASQGGTRNPGNTSGNTTPGTTDAPDTPSTDNPPTVPSPPPTGDSGNTSGNTTDTTGNDSTKPRPGTGTKPATTKLYTVTKIARLKGVDRYRITSTSGRQYDINRTDVIRIQGVATKTGGKSYRLTVKATAKFIPVNPVIRPGTKPKVPGRLPTKLPTKK